MTERRYLDEQERINIARAAMYSAARNEHGVSLEGEAESAYFRLETVAERLGAGDVDWARRELEEAVDLVNAYLERPMSERERDGMRHVRVLLADVHDRLLP